MKGVYKLPSVHIHQPIVVVTLMMLGNNAFPNAKPNRNLVHSSASPFNDAGLHRALKLSRLYLTDYQRVIPNSLILKGLSIRVPIIYRNNTKLVKSRDVHNRCAKLFPLIINSLVTY